MHTGNHARVVGAFVSVILEGDKPICYDHDVIIEKMFGLEQMLR